MNWILVAAEGIKPSAKFDCLKTPIVLGLESFELSAFHILATLIFLCAILHTFSVNQIHRFAKTLETRWKTEKTQPRTLSLQILYFLAEVEIIFALWAIPLFVVIWVGFDWRTALEYINTRDYTEPLFVVITMCLASTRPIFNLAETILRRIAKSLGGSLSAWWYTLLTLGPLLGSFITEIGAMALCALLLSRQFYEYKPSEKLAYATLGLLFVNISIGGVLTDFASPAVLVLAHCWKWNTWTMMTTYGWKAIVGITLSNGIYWFYFRKELAELDQRRALLNKNHTPRAGGHFHTAEAERENPNVENYDKSIVRRLWTRRKIRQMGPRNEPAACENDESSRANEPTTDVPLWITAVHVLVMVWIVMTSHYPAIFIGSFLFFLGFHQATRAHQYPIRLMRPLLIGLFLAGLIIHGGLQGWWVVDLLQKLSPLGVLGLSIALTGFNDNTAISYLSTLVPSWGEAYKYALFSGVVAGGGLTVIANAPNPAGYVLLRSHFKSGISPIKLFAAAALPTFILYLIYYFFGPLF